MSTQSKNGISWTDITFNPIVGCSKISDGCTHCWAERQARLHYHDEYPQGWDGHVRLFYERLEQPLHWWKPRKIAVGLMGDLFHDRVLSDFIYEIWYVMRDTPQHTYQILTKRPLRMLEWFKRQGYAPLPNVWIGVSVEDQATADERIPLLLQTPAAIKFISCEPLLGPIDFRKVSGFNRIGLDLRNWWVIVGGESGPGARPMHPDWVRSLRDQCVAASVPFHFKQWGEWAVKSEYVNSKDFGVLAMDGEWFPSTTGWNGRPIDPDTGEAYMIRVGKKAAGHLLDGKEWLQFPKGVDV
jgi:protein gp37